MQQSGEQGKLEPATRAIDRRRLRRKLTPTQQVAIGLAASLLGLFLLIDLLPSSWQQLGAALPAASAGMLLLWVGGIFLGRGGRGPSPTRTKNSGDAAQRPVA